MNRSNIWFRRFEIGFSVIATIAIVVVIGSNLSPLTSYRPNSPQTTIFSHGGDFAMRLNEIEIVKKGINPFDVWMEKIKLPPYVPFIKSATDECYEMMNAYTPWEYVYAYPLTLVSHNFAWYCYLVLMILCVVGIGWWTWQKGYLVRELWADGWFAASFSIGVVVYPLWVNFGTGNYDLLIVTLLLAMAFCLEGKHDVLAGICWALAMTKPQVSLLFAIPLLWRRKFLTCAVAASICVAATLLVSLQCHASPVGLILQASAASSHAFYGSGTMPYAIVRELPDYRDMLIVLGCAIGVLICIIQTWIVRRIENWIVFMLPAFVCSTAWTYAGDYVRVMMIPMLCFVILSLVNNHGSGAAWFFTTLSILFFSGAYSGYHDVVMYCAGILHFLLYDIEIHRTLVSLNSSVVIILSTFFFYWHVSHARISSASPHENYAINCQA